MLQNVADDWIWDIFMHTLFQVAKPQLLAPEISQRSTENPFFPGRFFLEFFMQAALPLCSPVESQNRTTIV